MSGRFVSYSAGRGRRGGTCGLVPRLARSPRPSRRVVATRTRGAFRARPRTASTGNGSGVDLVVVARLPPPGLPPFPPLPRPIHTLPLANGRRRGRARCRTCVRPGVPRRHPFVRLRGPDVRPSSCACGPSAPLRSRPRHSAAPHLTLPGVAGGPSAATPPPRGARTRLARRPQRRRKSRPERGDGGPPGRVETSPHPPPAPNGSATSQLASRAGCRSAAAQTKVARRIFCALRSAARKNGRAKALNRDNGLTQFPVHQSPRKIARLPTLKFPGGNCHALGPKVAFHRGG